MVPDEPQLAEVVANVSRNLKRIVQGKESNCGPKINCSGRAGINSVNLYFQAHKNSGGAAP